MGAPRRAAARRHFGGDGENQPPALFPRLLLWGEPGQTLDRSHYARKYELVAVSEGREGNSIRLRERNRFFRGQEVDVLQPGREPFTATLDQIYNQDWEPIEAAPHAEMVVHWKTDLDVAPGAYLRVK